MSYLSHSFPWRLSTIEKWVIRDNIEKEDEKPCIKIKKNKNSIQTFPRVFLIISRILLATPIFYPIKFTI
jgi:hypothetical protein